MNVEPWSIEIERRADRDLERLDRQVRDRVLSSIENLAANPEQANIRRLTNRPESRLRVGNWRVIFTIDHARRTVSVRRVLLREHAYAR
ncbi:MAG TPA: type II toxin-antitoxin system RelE/ParE family toxin [Solirubrobacteraceae bacterium]